MLFVMGRSAKEGEPSRVKSGVAKFPAVQMLKGPQHAVQDVAVSASSEPNYQLQELVEARVVLIFRAPHPA